MGKFSFDWSLNEATSQEFRAECERLQNVPGVYSFWTEASDCLYIGMSIDLGMRMQSSFKDRVIGMPGWVGFSTIVADCEGEAVELEAAMIAAWSPALNRDFRAAKKATLDISGYAWADMLPLKPAGVLARRRGKYIIYPHGSDLANEELRLLADKSDRRKSRWKTAFIEAD